MSFQNVKKHLQIRHVFFSECEKTLPDKSCFFQQFCRLALAPRSSLLWPGLLSPSLLSPSSSCPSPSLFKR